MKINLCVLEGGRHLARSEEYAAGYDLFARTGGMIPARSRVIIPLGIKTQFDRRYVGIIFGRSGLAAHNGLEPMGRVIDPTYPKEWGCILLNTSDHRHEYEAGDRICQVVFLKRRTLEVNRMTEKDLDRLASQVARKGGFGSTGR